MSLASLEVPGAGNGGGGNLEFETDGGAPPEAAAGDALSGAGEVADVE
jgi:hypothetical protein